MSFASGIVEDYFRRTAQPGDSALDACFMLERTILRDMLSRLEVILQDEDVDRGTAERVIRCMLYGSPSPAAAEERMWRDQEMVNLLNRTPPAFTLSAEAARDLGLRVPR